MITEDFRARLEYTLNDYRTKHLKSNKNEKQQNIPELIVNENGELLLYSLGNMKLNKHISNNMYTLESVNKLIPNIQRRRIVLFLTSSRFHYLLHSFDKDYNIPQYVYYIQFDNYVKIGRTFDIKQRYQPREINNRIKRLTIVKDANKCENALISNFNKKYKLYKGSEGFDITTQTDILESLKLFDTIVEKYETNLNITGKKHVEYYKTDKIYGTGYYLSPLATSITLHIFSNAEYKECKSFINTIESMYRNFNKSDYISTFQESGDTFFYWKFHNYVVIVNVDKNRINASRLWNTVINSQNKMSKKYQFRKYLQLTRTKEIFKNNPESRPVKYHYKNRPLLNGRYMPIVFAHFILEHLDAKYSYEVAKLMTSSISEKIVEASKQQKLTNSSNILGGDMLHMKQIEVLIKLKNTLNIRYA